MPRDNREIQLRKPHTQDGRAIHQLIDQCPPLDINSVYSYYLLSDHFSDTCVVAEVAGEVVGYVSAYFIPQRPDTLFVWQVAVHERLRGQGMAPRMLDALLTRFDGNGVQYLETTVNPSNRASRRVFERLAEQRGTAVTTETFLDAAAFGSGSDHESEMLLKIPLTVTNTSNQERPRAHI